MGVGAGNIFHDGLKAKWKNFYANFYHEAGLRQWVLSELMIDKYSCSCKSKGPEQSPQQWRQGKVDPTDFVNEIMPKWLKVHAQQIKQIQTCKVL